MGLFSRKNKIQPTNDMQAKNSMKAESSQNLDTFYIKQSKDRLQIDFIENKPKVGQFYDTTRLIVQNRNINFPTSSIYDCFVSWYGQSDAVMIDHESGEFIGGRRDNYTHVLAQIDLNLLKTDPMYLGVVMKYLLNESRVNRYMAVGMKTPEEIAKAKAQGNDSLDLCGRYIGGIAGKERNYQKFFDPSIGKKAHNLPDMVQARQKQKASRERAKQEEIAKLKAKLNEIETGFEK